MVQLTELVEIVGAEHVLTGAATESYVTDWRERFVGEALAVVRPASTQDVVRIVHWCRNHGVALVPQGGNTGLCGGATPDPNRRSIVLSLVRMNVIRSIDTDNDTMVVEAGCILQNVQDAAREAGRLFPLSMGA